MLEAHQITVLRGKRLVLGPLSIKLRPGELTVVCGPNGAGKSTLVKALSGELPISEGQVFLDGRAVAAMTAHELALRRAVVPQTTSLNFPFTVQEVVQLGASVPGFAANAIAWARGAIDRVGLSGMENRPYVELSGGERQRVHFARALCQLRAADIDVRQTTALFLDEPTSNLDLPHQGALLLRAREEARRGRIVIAVLHDLNLAARWADRILLLARGCIVGDGPPRRVIDSELLSLAYGCLIRANELPPDHTPFVLPQLLALEEPQIG